MHMQMVMIVILAMIALSYHDGYAFELVNGWLEKQKPDKKERKPWEDYLMFKKGSISAPAPDPAIGQAALKQAQLGEDWLAFAKDQYAVSNERQKVTDALSNQVVQQQLDSSKQASQWATDDRDRWTNTYKPVEDAYIQEASNYGSQENQDKLAAEAKANVLSNAYAQTQANNRSMASMGVNPNSGKFQAVNKAAEINTALSAAGAENAARQGARDKGLALKSDVANMGKGLASQAASNSSLGVSAGSSSLGSNLAANSSWNAGNQIMAQGYQGAMSGYGNQANILNTQYGNQLSAWSAQQQANSANSAGMWGGMGSMAGMGMMAF